MRDLSMFPNDGTKLASFFTELNRTIDAFRHRQRDIDRDGRIFLPALTILTAALAFRLVCISLAHVPLVGTDICASLTLSAGLILVSIVLARLDVPEATLLARAGAMAICAQALMLPFCALAFHVGRAVPYADAWLAAADGCLGLDWPAYFRYVDQRPLLWGLLDTAYHSIFVQPQAVCIILALTRKATRLYAMLVALVISLTIITGLAVFAPAIGPYLHFPLADALHPQDFPGDVAAAIRWLRGGIFDGVHDLPPLITFPSFHACSAVIFTWGLWRTPWVRWAALALNGAMLAATPIIGGHYLVDVVAGGLIGLITALATGRTLSAVRPVQEPLTQPAGYAGAEALAT